MQVRPREIHIPNLAGRIEQIKDIGKLLCVLELCSFLSPFGKELLEPFVPEAFYHLMNT